MEKRVVWLDTARSVAIMSVVLCHASEAIYSYDMEFISKISFQSKICAFVFLTCGRLGVPLFFFISGYLLLDRKYDEDRCLSFWKKNLLGLLCTVEIWILFYNIFLSWFYERDFQFGALVKNMLFLSNVELSHMWYIPVILGIYIFLPFIAQILYHVNIELLKMPMTVIWVCLFIVPVVSVVSLSLGFEKIECLLTVSFGGGYYIFYLMWGYFTKKNVLEQFSKRFLVGVGLLSFLCVVFLQLFALDKGYAYNVWYNNACLFICAILLFEFISRKARIERGYIKNLSKCSFGIYLIHNPICLILGKWIDFRGILPIKVLELFFCVFLISWLIVCVVGRMPKIGKVLFYIK